MHAIWLTVIHCNFRATASLTPVPSPNTDFLLSWIPVYNIVNREQTRNTRFPLYNFSPRHFDSWLCREKKRNRSLFFFFFNVIKATDHHRGLTQREISLFQLIASLFFFFSVSIGRPPTEGFIPLPLVSRPPSENNEIRRIYWSVLLSGSANFISGNTQSRPALNWSWIVTSRFDLLPTHDRFNVPLLIIKRYSVCVHNALSRRLSCIKASRYTAAR